MNSKTNFNIFVINLDSSVQRMENAERELGKFSLPFIRVSAVNGRRLSSRELEVKKAVEFSGYYKLLSPSEIGCYESHRKCWKIMLRNKLEYAIILEDDFIVNENLLNFENYFQKINCDWDFIKLLEFPEKRKVTESVKCLDKQLVRYNKIPSRTGAYVVSRSGAIKMLRHSKRISRPVDIDLQYWWESGITVFGLKPYMVSINESYESTIDVQSNRSKVKKSFIKQYTQKLQFYLGNRRYQKPIQ